MKTLVLNSSYAPLGAIEWERAVVLIFSNKAEMLEAYNEPIKTISGEYKKPAVIKLKKYVKASSIALRFNKRNIYLRDEGKCGYCNIKMSYRQSTFDHIIPKSRGGKTNWTNIISACKDCNRDKNNKTPEEANMPLRRKADKPNNIDTIKNFYKNYKSKAPHAWKNWI